jgi:hypothetical protein
MDRHLNRMPFSLRARRLIVGISIVMLLLCQTAAASLVYAIQAPSPPAQPAANSVPCSHEAVDTKGSTPDHGCHHRCPSRYASAKAAKPDIPHAGTLALTVFSMVVPDTAAVRTAPYRQIPANAAPPPLLLVYCRLLI